MLFNFLTYGTIIALYAQLIFILWDYVQLSHAKFWAGVMLSLMGVVSVVAAVTSMRQGERAFMSRRAYLTPCLLFAVATLFILGKAPLWGLFIASVFSGFAGGRIFVLSRLQAAYWLGSPGRNVMVSRYNNVPNITSLLAFLFLGLFALVMGEDIQTQAPVLLLLLTSFLVVAGCLSWWYELPTHGGTRQETQTSNM
ncbi:MAG: hypothetical protein EP343_25065 [Deltaproteobacteria bacterium]|nr:MAG: hypothetical protein EP343_25065 [Deltaproteobacteria bacterium]